MKEIIEKAIEYYNNTKDCTFKDHDIINIFNDILHNTDNETYSFNFVLTTYETNEGYFIIATYWDEHLEVDIIIDWNINSEYEAEELAEKFIELENNTK